MHVRALTVSGRGPAGIRHKDDRTSAQPRTKSVMAHEDIVIFARAARGARPVVRLTRFRADRPPLERSASGRAHPAVMQLRTRVLALVAIALLASGCLHNDRAVPLPWHGAVTRVVWADVARGALPTPRCQVWEPDADAQSKGLTR